jgi:uncharacterized membrane protein
MMRAWLPSAGAVLLLGACAQPAPPPPPVVAAPPPPPATAPKLQLRGQAVMGKDGYGIVPCGEQGQRILEVAPVAKPFLDKFLEGGAHEFFVEAEAEVPAEGRVRVLRFHRLYTEGPGCNAPLNSMRFAAWGNEPFWAAVDAGDALRLERPGAEPLVAQPRSTREEAGDWIVEGQTAAGALSLRLSPGYCSDGMSDTLYAWNATVRWADQELKGCGFRGSGAEAP